MIGPGAWTAEIRVLCASPDSARRLHRVLGPESAREVPRARAFVPGPSGRSLAIRIETKDTGALRAALQTFLGWVQLEAETSELGAGSATGGGRGPGPSKPLSRSP